MKTNLKIYKTLCIDITTYRKRCKSNRIDKNMNALCLDKHNKSQNKFICSICLNQKAVNDHKGPELRERKSRSCPVCQCSCSYSTDDDSTLTKRSKQSKSNLLEDDRRVTKDIQTSHADVHQGLSLLNEVLNVFQSKKQLGNPKEGKNKTVIYKDVGVSTEDIIYRIKPKLSKSKIFHCSIEENTGSENKFIIVNSTQPDTIFTLHKSLDLINHKSSSIPQMKMEELKKSLKTKTKSKDVIEEANRMFATVTRIQEKESGENRPMVRSGPRVLPVVKTGNFETSHDITENRNPKSDPTCKPCHGNNYHLSGGDSSNKKCCYNCNKYRESNDECTYTMCCHYQQNRLQTKELICKRCRMSK